MERGRSKAGWGVGSDGGCESFLPDPSLQDLGLHCPPPRCGQKATPLKNRTGQVGVGFRAGHYFELRTVTVQRLRENL